MDEAESELFAVAEGNIRKDYESMASLLFKAQNEIENAMLKEDGVNGVATGFTDLDRITSGWQKSDMIVVAARPGMGKTAFVLSMARNVAVDYQHPVAIFSLEMSSIQLVNRSTWQSVRGELGGISWSSAKSRLILCMILELFAVCETTS